jgi:hypothetical protein
MKKVTLETVHKALCTVRDDCDKMYDELLEKQLSAKTNTAAVWARSDKEKFTYISEVLSDIIYRIEEWQTI